MLESPLQMEFAYRLLSEEISEEDSKIDDLYEKLKTNIVPLEPESDEYLLMCKYVENIQRGMPISILRWKAFTESRGKAKMIVSLHFERCVIANCFGTALDSRTLLA